MGWLRKIGRKIDKGIRKTFGKNGWLKAAATVAALTFAAPILVEFKQPLQIKVRWLNASNLDESAGLRIKVTLIGERGIRRSVN